MPDFPALSGSMPALVTPFRNGAVDFDALAALIEWQIEAGSTGLVPVGTTGESPTLSHEEHEAVIEATVVKAAAGRVPVIAGAGSNNTAEAIRFVQHAEAVGAERRAGGDALLQQADPGRADRPFQRAARLPAPCRS
jgi:dihydrodipicolinate synthase/N-acetylneuraminate lyase